MKRSRTSRLTFSEHVLGIRCHRRKNVSSRDPWVFTISRLLLWCISSCRTRTGREWNLWSWLVVFIRTYRCCKGSARQEHNTLSNCYDIGILHFKILGKGRRRYLWKNVLKIFMSRTIIYLTKFSGLVKYKSKKDGLWQSKSEMMIETGYDTRIRWLPYSYPSGPRGRSYNVFTKRLRRSYLHDWKFSRGVVFGYSPPVGLAVALVPILNWLFSQSNFKTHNRSFVVYLASG